jgi:hypothetical protein
MGLGPESEMRNPEKNLFWIPGSKRHRIPDPDPQHWHKISITLNTGPEYFSTIYTTGIQGKGSCDSKHLMTGQPMKAVFQIRIRDYLSGSGSLHQQQKN